MPAATLAAESTRRAVFRSGSPDSEGRRGERSGRARRQRKGDYV